MRFWQVWVKFGGYWRPTTEYVQAETYAAALDEFAGAVRMGNSGFTSPGEFDVKESHGMPGTFNGVATRLATTTPYTGKPGTPEPANGSLFPGAEVCRLVSGGPKKRPVTRSMF